MYARAKWFARKGPVPVGAGLSASSGGYDQPMGVLIVDDEAELADAIATYLQAFGLEAEYVVDGASALAAFDARPPKLVVLDVNLPDVNGFEVCRTMRAKSDVPILFLSARGSDDDQILALGLGGDDYVRKPVSLAVLLAKVRRMLDRLGQPRGFRDDWLVVDDDADRVFVDGVEIKLTAMEHRLLRHLVANRGRVVPKEELFTAVWDSPLTGDATLSVHVRRLRTHIEFIDKFFAPGEVAEIWLTFSDPQMKKVTKRLTSTYFLARYRHFLTDNGLVHLKTDSNFLFTYTDFMVQENHLPVEFRTDNLYHTLAAEEDKEVCQILGIRTYYEQQWLDRGLNIKYLKFRLPQKGTLVEPDVEIELDAYRSYNRSKRSGLETSR